jgi:hypothetical protein
MLHDGVRSGVDQADVPIVGPPDQIWRAIGFPSDLEDLGIPIVLPHVVTPDDEPVPNAGLHRSSFPNRFMPELREASLDHEDRYPRRVEDPVGDASYHQPAPH